MKTKTINKFDHSWKPIGSEPKVYDGDTYKMRPMQFEVYKELRYAPYSIINAPTASGKTLAICWLVARKLEDNPKRKAIIVVPQTIIANGFKG